MSYPANIARRAPVRVTGIGGIVLSAGTTVTTEANIRAIVISTGTVKVTHETPSIPGSETLAHYLWGLGSDGEWARVVSSQYGDWTYLSVGAGVPYDRAVVRESSPDAVEVAFQVDAFSVASAFGGLGLRRRDDANEGLDYPISSSTAKTDSVFAFTKTIRVERGFDGYFVGYSFYPDVLPGEGHVPSYNDVPDYGEIEIGPGYLSAVSFSMVAGSLVATARHPAWGADARWAAADAQAGGTITGRPFGTGIYDPDGTYQPTYFALSQVRALQHATFPARPTTGPYVAAAINASVPFVVHMHLRYPMYVLGSQYDPAQSGVLRVLYYRQKRSSSGQFYRLPIFIGALPYTADSSSSYANEPTAALQTSIARLASNLSWPEAA